MKKMIPEDAVPSCVYGHDRAKHYSPDALYTPRERADLISTARNWKHKLAVEKAFHLLREDDTILDYGCGRHCSLLKRLRAQNYHADGWDLCFDLYVPWEQNNKRSYDVVIASNVLNVQPDTRRAVEVLEELGRLAGRLIIFNYPNSPRKWKCAAKMVRVIAKICLPEWDLKHEYYGSGTLTVATRKEGS